MIAVIVELEALADDDRLSSMASSARARSVDGTVRPRAFGCRRHVNLRACYFLIIIVIRHETTAAARWALLLIVRTLSNDAITVAVWAGFGFHSVPPCGHPASPNPPTQRNAPGEQCFRRASRWLITRRRNTHP
jgi:hypothetical protein